MDLFGNGGNKISITEIIWYIAIGFLIWLAIQCPSENWTAMKELVNNESIWVTLQMKTARLLWVAGLFTAFLQNLYYRGTYRLRTAEASLCIFGLNLVMLELTLERINIRQVLPHLWAGRIFMMTGFLLMAALLFKDEKSNLRFTVSNIICFTILLLVCIFPACSVYGVLLPVAAVSVYDIRLIYNKETKRQEQEKNQSVLAKENNTIKVNAEDIERKQEHSVEESKENTPELESILKDSEKEMNSKTPEKEDRIREKDAVCEIPVIEKEMIASLPESFTEFYLYDRKEKKIYRFNRDNSQMYLAGEGAEPELLALIEEKQKEAFKEFLEKYGARQICTKMWNRDVSEYRDMIVTAGSFSGKEEIDQILFLDNTKTKELYENAIESLNNNIKELKCRVELAEDEEYRVFIAANELLNDIIARKSNESKTHLKNIKGYVEIILTEIGKRYPGMNLDKTKIHELSEAALLHDIGKIEVPDHILNKQDQLTEEEFEEMKKHTVYGAQLINRMPYVQKYEAIMNQALEFALHHHERYDGNGYPDGLKGDQIPICVQAVSLADAYEALTSNRVYRAGVAHEEACRMIHEGSCGAFSNEMLDILDTVGNDLRDKHYRIETTL